MCSPTILNLQLDFSDTSFHNINLAPLSVVLTVATFTSTYGAKNTLTTRIPISSFIAPISRRGGGVYRRTISLSSIGDFCAPGSSWSWVGLSSIALADGTSDNTFTNLLTNGGTTRTNGGSIGPNVYVSAPAAYVAYQQNVFTLLFGDSKLTPPLLQNKYSATCSSSSYSSGGICYYLMPIGGTMNLTIKPNVIGPKTTIPTMTTTVNTVIFDVLQYGRTSSIVTTSTEKLIVGFIIILIIFAIIAAIVYAVTRPKDKTKKIVTVESE